MAIINKNQFFTILSKHNANRTFSQAMLRGDLPAEDKYQFDSTYEWDLSLPAVQGMLEAFVLLGMVPKEVADEINALAQDPPLDIRDKRYDVRAVSGEVVRWIEENIRPIGTAYIIESEPLIENGEPVMLRKGPALKETGVIRTTGVLYEPAVEVK